MALDASDIDRIANLARLELTPLESERMLTQINGFFSIVEKMSAVDTTGLDPAAVRCAVELVGADHVVMGTDWPVVQETGAKIEAVLAASGLDRNDQSLIASGNCLRLLNITQ